MSGEHYYYVCLLVGSPAVHLFDRSCLRSVSTCMWDYSPIETAPLTLLIDRRTLMQCNMLCLEKNLNASKPSNY